MMEKKKVKAVKDGKVYTFSAKAWQIGNHVLHGFKLIGELDEIDKIEVEEVGVKRNDGIERKEIQTVEIPDEKVDKVDKKEEGGEYPTEEEMRKYLKGLADEGAIKKPPHRLLGIDKLKKMYDENKK